MTADRDGHEPVPVEQVSPGWPDRTGYTGVICRCHASPAMLAALGRAFDPGSPARQFVLEARGKTVCRVVVEAPGCAALYVKVYTVNGALARAQILTRTHRADRAWRIGLRLAARGVPTPQPVALLTRPGRATVTDVALATEEIPNAVSVAAHVDRSFAASNNLGDPGTLRHKRTLITRLARFLAMLHRAGIYHGDFSADNIVIDQASEQVYLIDLDAVRSTRWISRRRRIKNLEEFGRNFLDLRVCSPWDRARFLREYQRAWSGPAFASLAPRKRGRRHERLIRAVWRRTQASLRKRGQRFEPAQ